MLLESLIAILIFSFGILGIVGLQAQSIRHVNDMQYRGEAIFLANSLISQMWTDDRSTLASKYTGTGAGYTAFRDLVKRLPGADLSVNAPTVTIAAGPSTTSNVVTVTVFWQLPGEPTPHNYSTTAVVGFN
jgi:type IV pilus assembly protein PilV